MAYLLIFFLLMGSAFFSGTEIAYTSLSKLKMKRDADDPDTIHKLVSFIYNHYDYALSTVLVGNNLVNIGATSVATVLAVNLALRMDGRITDQTASTIVTLVMTVLRRLHAPPLRQVRRQPGRFRPFQVITDMALP